MTGTSSGPGWRPPLPPPTPGSRPVDDLDWAPQGGTPPPFDEGLLDGPAFDEEPAEPRPEDWWQASGLPDNRPAPTPLAAPPRRNRRWPVLLAIALVAGVVGWVLSRSEGKATAPSVTLAPVTTPSASDNPAATPTTVPEPVPATVTPVTVTTDTATTAPTPSSAAPTSPNPPETAAQTTPPSVATADATATSTTGPAPTNGGDGESTEQLPTGVAFAVAGADIVRLVNDSGELPMVLGSVETAFVFPDRGGLGVIYQRRSTTSIDAGGEPAATDDTDIIRVRPDGSSLILYPAQRGRRLRLHDVRMSGSAPVVLYSAEAGDGTELLKLARPVDGSTVDLGSIGGPSSRISRLHLGGSLVVGEELTDDVSRLFSRSIDGGPGLVAADLDLRDVPTACREACIHSFSIDVDGATLAWIEGQDLVITRRDGAAKPRRVALPEGFPVDGADIRLGNGIAVVNPALGTSPETAASVVIDLRPATATAVRLERPGFTVPI